MAYLEQFRIKLEHEYFGADALPLSITPADPQKFRADGFLLRQKGARITVLTDDKATDLPAAVDLLLNASNENLWNVTVAADRSIIPAFHLPLGSDRIELVENQPRTKLRPNRVRFAALHLERDPRRARDVMVKFYAISSYWAYHITGPGIARDLAIVDERASVSFDDLGQHQLPNGQPVKVLRSHIALPARARPAHRFTLQAPGPSGPVVLIPALPVADAVFTPVDIGGETHLQSDIHVFLA